MKSRTLGGIPGFLSFLTTTCDPAAVVEAVVTGPAEHFAARAGVMVVKREETLSLIASYGHGQAELDGLQEFPLDTDNPLCEAWREGETIVAGTKPVEGVFADLTPITARWAQLGVWQGQNTFACTPLTAHGTSIGAIGIICADERSWSTLDIALLGAIGRSIAVWLVHPDVGLVLPMGTEAPALTSRQRAILALVAAGKTNTAIAHVLGCSESTVKQDLRQALRSSGPGSREARARLALGSEEGGGR